MGLFLIAACVIILLICGIVSWDAVIISKLRNDLIDSESLNARAELEFTTEIQEMQNLCVNDPQKEAVLYVMVYFHKEVCFKKSQIELMLSFLAKHGIKGEHFRDLFLFLQTKLVSRGYVAEAVYLGETC